MDALFELRIQSVLVEGGVVLLQSFIEADIWDEIRIITNNNLKIGEGLSAPEFTGGIVKEKINLLSDTICTWIKK
jgi:diaminohydroxyphosphoribosylaminopyrimidine deaminase/5-amino-6-(5-phosphoribosylamino)uracil reductase